MHGAGMTMDSVVSLLRLVKLVHSEVQSSLKYHYLKMISELGR